MNNILVIEDEKSILEFLRKVLSHFGYSVRAALDGEEGLEMFDNGYDFDLVITDIDMPKLNGNDVAKHIRRSDKSATPVIGITGSDACVEREFFDMLLIKPFRLETLVDTLNRVIPGRKTLSGSVVSDH